MNGGGRNNMDEQIKNEAEKKDLNTATDQEKSKKPKKEKKVKEPKVKKKKPHRVRNIVLLIILVVIIILIMLFVRSCQESQKVLTTIVEQHAAVERSDIENTIALSGTVKSNKSQQISAPAQLEVLTLDVQEGDQVTQGQIMATLDTTTLEFDIRTAEVNLKNAKISDSAKSITTSNSKRQERNAAKSSKADLEIAEEKYQQAKEKMEAINQGRYKDSKSMETDENGKISEADRLASAVVQAKLDYEAAKRNYDELLKQNGNTSTVVASRLDLEAAQRKYDEAIDGTSAKFDLDKALLSLETAKQKEYDTQIKGDEDIKNAQRTLESAAQKLYDAQVQGQESVRKAQLSLDGAYNSSNQVYANASSSGYQVNEASISIAQAQEALNSAVTQRDSNIVAAQRAVDEANSALQTAMTNRDSNNMSAKRSVEEAQLAYDNAQKAAEDAKVAQKEALDRAQSAYDAAINNSSDEVKKSYDTLRTTQVAYEAALQAQEDSYKDASNSLKKAQLAYNSAISNANAASAQEPDSIELQEIALEKLKQQLDDSVIRAPISGTVTSSNVEIGKVATGVMFTINDTQDLIVEATVNEFDIGSIAVGQKARIGADSLGDDKIEGTVVSVAESSVQSAQAESSSTTTNSSKVSFNVKIKIDKIDPRLRIGMNAQVTVITEEKKSVLVVPIDAITFTGDQATVRVKKELPAGQTPKEGEPTSYEVPVTVGIQTNTSAEITSGDIKEGDMIVTGTSTGLEDLMNGNMPDGAVVQIG